MHRPRHRNLFAFGTFSYTYFRKAVSRSPRALTKSTSNRAQYLLDKRASPGWLMDSSWRKKNFVHGYIKTKKIMQEPDARTHAGRPPFLTSATSESVNIKWSITRSRFLRRRFWQYIRSRSFFTSPWILGRLLSNTSTIPAAAASGSAYLLALGSPASVFICISSIPIPETTYRCKYRVVGSCMAT